MNTYRVKDGIDRDLPGIGRTVNGMITTAEVIEHPLFELQEPTPAQETPAQEQVVPQSPPVNLTQPATPVSQVQPLQSAVIAAPIPPTEEIKS